MIRINPLKTNNFYIVNSGLLPIQVDRAIELKDPVTLEDEIEFQGQIHDGHDLQRKLNYLKSSGALTWYTVDFHRSPTIPCKFRFTIKTAHINDYINTNVGQYWRGEMNQTARVSIHCECGAEAVGSGMHSDYCPVALGENRSMPK